MPMVDHTTRRDDDRDDAHDDSPLLELTPDREERSGRMGPYARRLTIDEIRDDLADSLAEVRRRLTPWRSTDADEEAGADGRQRIGFRGVRIAFLRAAANFSRHGASDGAAALTYYFVLALFPGALAVVSLLSIVNTQGTVTKGLLDFLAGIVPADVLSVIEEPLEQVTSTPAAGLSFVVGLVGAIWSASKYVDAFSRNSNRVYGVEEGRSSLVLRATVLVVTLIGLVGVAVMCALLVLSGPVAEAIGAAVGLGDEALAVWSVVRWVVLALIGVIVVAVLFHFSPNVRPSAFRWISVGAFTALVVWAGASTGFFLYAANAPNFGATYGSLGGIIVFLLWLYLSNSALLFGVEVDAELERARQLRSGIHAEYAIRLPLRGESTIASGVEAEAKQVLSARTLLPHRARRRGRGRRDAASQ